MKQINQQKSEMEWEELEKLLRLWHYENIREKGINELKDFIRQTIAQSRQQFAEEIEEDLITRLAELRFAGLEDMIDSLSAEIKELIQDKLTKE